MKTFSVFFITALALSLASTSLAQNNSLVNININPSTSGDQPQDSPPQNSQPQGGGILNLFLGNSDGDRHHQENERIAQQMYEINMQNLAAMERQAKTQDEIKRIHEERRLAGERLRWDREHHDVHPGQNYPEHLRPRYVAHQNAPQHYQQPAQQPGQQPRQQWNGQNSQKNQNSANNQNNGETEHPYRHQN